MSKPYSVIKINDHNFMVHFGEDKDYGAPILHELRKAWMTSLC